MWALQCAGIAPVQLPAQVTLAEEPLTREKTASMVLAVTVRDTLFIWTEVTGLLDSMGWVELEIILG